MKFLEKLEKQPTKEVNETIELVKGGFTPSEAYHVVSALIREKVNFHKIHRLRQCEGDCNSDISYSNSRIEELESQLNLAQQFLQAADALGKEVNVESSLKITLK